MFCSFFYVFFHSDAPYLAYSLVPFARLPRWASSLWAFGSRWRESFKKEWGKSAAFPFAPVQGKRRNVSLETFQSILSNNPFIKLPMQGVTTDLKWAAQVKDLMEEDAAAKLTAQPDFYFFWYVTTCWSACALTLSLPWCHLKTTSKRVNFRSWSIFVFFFALHVTEPNWKLICYRTWKMYCLQARACI